MKFPCTLKNALLTIRDHFGMSFASKGLGYLAALLFLLSLLARYKLSCYKTTRYLQFQHLQTIPYRKLLVISFCSSLGSTLLLIEKSYNWSPILVGHQPIIGPLAFRALDSSAVPRTSSSSSAMLTSRAESSIDCIYLWIRINARGKGDRATNAHNDVFDERKHFEEELDTNFEKCFGWKKCVEWTSRFEEYTS